MYECVCATEKLLPSLCWCSCWRSRDIPLIRAPAINPLVMDFPAAFTKAHGRDGSCLLSVLLEAQEVTMTWGSKPGDLAVLQGTRLGKVAQPTGCRCPNIICWPLIMFLALPLMGDTQSLPRGLRLSFVNFVLE